MDLNYTDEDIRFRDEVRAFIDEAFTPDLQQQMSRSKNGYMSKQAHLIWQKRLYEKGWAAPNWPAEHGGHGAHERTARGAWGVCRRVARGVRQAGGLRQTLRTRRLEALIS